MIRIQQIKLRPEQGEEVLKKKVSHLLHIAEDDIKELAIVKKSLDARKKPELFFSYTVDVKVAGEEKIVKRCKDGQVTLHQEVRYQFPKVLKKPEKRPVVVGMGPAGLFCGYFLAKAGLCPLILERGKDVDHRQQDVDAFWQDGIFHQESNVQFGEGGAGTFSDGKLNTLVKDKYGRNGEVLKLLCEFGAPAEILYESKPHVGTDILKNVVKNMRLAIMQMGGEVCFESMVTELLFEKGRLTGLVVNGERRIDTDRVVLAIGHSARNTFEMLYEKGISMEAKPFAVGFRVEHEQEMIDISQYGKKQEEGLPAAAYKLAGKTRDGRGVYSFCMCPGGFVVNASSEDGRLCVNGMSYSRRDGKNANSAIVVAVSPEDFGSDHPLAGMHFQRALEEKAYKAGKGAVPVQTYGAFKAKVTGTPAPEEKNSHLTPCIKGAFTYTDITEILPQSLNQGIVDGMEEFGRKIRGFNRPDTLLSAVESRTSSPVRIPREDESLQSITFQGLYPCGEGAGYAGGITSAAMDGIKVAEAIVESVNGS